VRKGVNAWVFPGEFTVDDTLEAGARVGYDGVELNIDEAKLDPYRVTRGECERIAEKAGSLGIELPSICGGLFWKYNLGGLDETVRKKGVDLIRKGCEFASNLGAKVLLVVPAVATPQVPYKEMWERSKKAVLEAAPAAEDYGVYIGVENVWNRFLYSPLEFKAFLKDVNHDYVKAYFDAGNVLFLGFPQHWIEVLATDIVCVHVKDFNMEKREFRHLLQGDVPWKEVVSALSRVGYDYFLNLEVGPIPGDPLKAASENKRALDEILSIRRN